MKGHDFAGNQARLAKAVLEELPTQLALYMELRGIKPGPGRREPNASIHQPSGPPPPAYDSAASLPPGAGAPYPPGSGAPYPPGAGAPYPPVNGAPPTNAPYPPPASNPFYPSAP